MDKRKYIDNFLKQQDRFNKKTESSKKQPTNQQTNKDYNFIHKRFKILCNNSIGGGDCYGDTMCACKCFLYDTDFNKYYSKEPRREDLHHDFKCNKCVFKICGCCFSVCPNCGESENIEILPW